MAWLLGAKLPTAQPVVLPACVPACLSVGLSVHLWQPQSHESIIRVEDLWVEDGKTIYITQIVTAGTLQKYVCADGSMWCVSLSLWT